MIVAFGCWRATSCKLALSPCIMLTFAVAQEVNHLVRQSGC